MSDEKRLIDIETKILHQEYLLEELNQVVYQQQVQIDLLEKKMNQFIKRIEGAVQADNEIRGHEKPPHY